MHLEKIVEKLSIRLDAAESRISHQQASNNTINSFESLSEEISSRESQLVKKRQVKDSMSEKLSDLLQFELKLDHLLGNVPGAIANASEIQLHVQKSRLKQSN